MDMIFEALDAGVHFEPDVHLDSLQVQKCILFDTDFVLILRRKKYELVTS